jgi:hypothetical protein
MSVSCSILSSWCDKYSSNDIINNDFIYSGMDSVLPNKEPYFPQMNQKVSIYVGEPLIFDELVQKMKKENRSLV